MLSRSCSGVAKPTFLLVYQDLPVRLSWRSDLPLQRRYDRRILQISRYQTSVSERNPSSGSDGSAAVRPNRVRLGRRDGSSSSSSLYSRPSLAEMKRERIKNRARVYEFLRGIGIAPDELDGLELPVTIEVMKERVDFLHNLGLTIEDINNYPLVLGLLHNR